MGKFVQKIDQHAGLVLYSLLKTAESVMESVLHAVPKHHVVRTTTLVKRTIGE